MLDNSTNLTDTVNKYCRFSLNTYQNTQKELYCRFDKKSSDTFVSNTSKCKSLADCNQKLFNVVNKNFRTRGFEADLSTSLLCYTDPALIPNFGNLYAIFPFDGFKFSYSNLITDIKNINLSFDDTIAFNLKQLQSYSNTNFTDAMNNSYEILISGKYLALSC